jgi:hypothetical protein
MAREEYLADYAESIESLPAEISKNLRLMGELDEKLQGALRPLL